jgi:GntR family transcriptional regulator
MANRSSYAASHIPKNIGWGTAIVQEDTGPGGIQPLTEEQGLCFERYHEEIAERRTTEEEARLLDLPAGSPVPHLVRTAIASGRPVEVCDTALDAAAIVLDYRLPAPAD